MSETIREDATVKRLGDGLLFIRYDHHYSNGLGMGGDFICEESAAGWLADRIEEGVDLWDAPDVDRDMPPDHFRIFTRGGEHGEDVNVHIHNLRDLNASYGKIYALSGISPGVARKLVADLRALMPQ